MEGGALINLYSYGVNNMDFAGSFHSMNRRSESARSVRFPEGTISTIFALSQHVTEDISLSRTRGE